MHDMNAKKISTTHLFIYFSADRKENQMESVGIQVTTNKNEFKGGYLVSQFFN